MWKESYGIGVEAIDTQHKALFGMVEQLVMNLEKDEGGEYRKRECKDAIEFMKRYVVTHFNEEEIYQERIGYSDRKEHKNIHEKFSHDLWLQEKILISSDFDQSEVKQLAGMLTAWLINHVADDDQKIVTGRPPKVSASSLTVMQAFVRSVSETLERMIAVDTQKLTGKPLAKDDLRGEVFAKIGIVGEVQGSVTYGFSKEFALEAIGIMTMMDIKEIDELVCSAMAEIANIISGNTTILLEDMGYRCDITAPEITLGTAIDYVSDLEKKILINTPIGELMIATSLNNHP